MIIMDSVLLNNLSKCASLINQLGSDNFRTLLDLIYGHYMNICGSQSAFTSDIPFSLNDDELGELQRLTGAGATAATDGNPTDDDSCLLSMATLVNFIAEIAKTNAKPKTINAQLNEAGWRQDKVELFIEFWKSRASEAIEHLKDHSFKYSAQLLTNVEWKIKLLSDHSCEHQPKLPVAEINFQFAPDEHLSLNFNHKELFNLYDQLEIIQTKIDKLYNQ